MQTMLKCIVALSTFMVLYSHHHHPSPEFLHLPTLKPVPIKHKLFSPPPFQLW